MLRHMKTNTAVTINADFVSDMSHLPNLAALLNSDVRFAETVRRPPVWTARCKSGYEFSGKPCNRPCPRGNLLCNRCLSAEVIPASIPEPRDWSRIGDLVFALFMTAGFVAIAIGVAVGGLR